MEEVREGDGEKEECESPDASNIESKKASGEVIKSRPQGKSHLNRKRRCSLEYPEEAVLEYPEKAPEEAALEYPEKAALEYPAEAPIEYPGNARLRKCSVRSRKIIKVKRSAIKVKSSVPIDKSFDIEDDSPSANELFKVKTLPPLGGVKGNDGSGTAASGGQGNNG